MLSAQHGRGANMCQPGQVRSVACFLNLRSTSLVQRVSCQDPSGKHAGDEALQRDGVCGGQSGVSQRASDQGAPNHFMPPAGVSISPSTESGGEFA